jgi:hypothetical protein
VKRGVISLSTPLLLGPDIGDASFKPAAIKSIHYKRLPVAQVSGCVWVCVCGGGGSKGQPCRVQWSAAVDLCLPDCSTCCLCHRSWSLCITCCPLFPSLPCSPPAYDALCPLLPPLPLCCSHSSSQVVAGQTAALALKKVKRGQVRKEGGGCGGACKGGGGSVLGTGRGERNIYPQCVFLPLFWNVSGVSNPSCCTPLPMLHPWCCVLHTVPSAPPSPHCTPIPAVPLHNPPGAPGDGAGA